MILTLVVVVVTKQADAIAKMLADILCQGGLSATRATGNSNDKYVVHPLVPFISFQDLP
jgi:hypothetical protein